MKFIMKFTAHMILVVAFSSTALALNTTNTADPVLIANIQASAETNEKILQDLLAAGLTPAKAVELMIRANRPVNAVFVALANTIPAGNIPYVAGMVASVFANNLGLVGQIAGAAAAAVPGQALNITRQVVLAVPDAASQVVTNVSNAVNLPLADIQQVANQAVTDANKGAETTNDQGDDNKGSGS